ncbi:MAG: UDP-N-acetylmuramoyl-tripeptide--D-alanyl-D-alanine ligase [Spirochaetia bacterium]|jgi:UDP-N-acetylmuramoyl-tripeptide--D-alanyl-D-alanine ligase|nr:UDP-N-acetylmuramoyl-tripeptide--D-alanyl-D-alanine ligase [Spirochaetia bacterium]
MGFASYRYGIYSIANFSGARVVRQCSKKILGIGIDTRVDLQDKLFVALRGSRVNGHLFLDEALAKGASALLVDGEHIAYACELANKWNAGVLVCDDTLRTLQTLSAAYIAQFPDITYVGITGSCGKSTTKQALAAILSAKGNVAMTPGNLNSEIGLPLSLLQVDSSTDYGVFEMAVDHKGEMDRHLSMLPPSYAIVTNISYAHAGKLGSQRNIAKEKSKIYHADLIAGYVSRDCNLRPLLQHRSPVRLKSFSKDDLDVTYLGLDGCSLSFGKEKVRLPLIAPYQMEDVSAAVAVARDMGISDEQLCDGLRFFHPLPGRGTVSAGPITVIEDCYNASPSSTAGILGYLGNLKWGGRKKAVLGSMTELGKYSKPAHRKIGRLLASLGLDTIFLFGSNMEAAYAFLKESRYPGKLFFSDDFGKLSYAVEADMHCGDLFLLKGSRVMEMERLIPLLKGAV